MAQYSKIGAIKVSRFATVSKIWDESLLLLSDNVISCCRRFGNKLQFVTKRQTVFLLQSSYLRSNYSSLKRRSTEAYVKKLLKSVQLCHSVGYSSYFYISVYLSFNIDMALFDYTYLWRATNVYFNIPQCWFVFVFHVDIFKALYMHYRTNVSI